MFFGPAGVIVVGPMGAIGGSTIGRRTATTRRTLLVDSAEVDGLIWLGPEGTKCFCEDLSEQEQKLVWATQGTPQPRPVLGESRGNRLEVEAELVHRRQKKDHTVHPDLERFFAKRMSATTYELDSSHVPMLSQPERVIEVVRAAAKAA